MIAKLTGIIDEILEDSIIIDVNGVGYQVFITAKLRATFEIGEKISLKISHIFKQENQFLCGFQYEDEKNAFKVLMEVPGIGIKSAMTILSVLSLEDLATSIATQDASILCKVPGVGRKTAERILLELKDKNIAKIKDVYDKSNENINDAVLGLISLGYQKSVVQKTIINVYKRLGSNTPTNELIVESLKEINK